MSSRGLGSPGNGRALRSPWLLYRYLLLALLALDVSGGEPLPDEIFADGFEGDPPPPTECDLVPRSNRGCEFFAVDTSNPLQSGQFAVIVVNVGVAAGLVEVQERSGGIWSTLQSTTVMAGGSHQFDLPDRDISGTGINASGAFRILSAIPITAVQYQPISGETSFSSDASLLLPVSALSDQYYLTGWGDDSPGDPQFDVIAVSDDTTVTIRTSAATIGGGTIPALAAGATHQIANLMAGDVVQIEAAQQAPGFGGTRITADSPIAVLSTHTCANVPGSGSACDHLEEQMFGVDSWGTSAVAARFPVRSSGTVEAAYWQVIAAEDGTTVTFDSNPAVTGLPPSLTLDAGQTASLAVAGTATHPGDFVATANHPILLTQYLSSASETDAETSQAGDPAMSLSPPVTQFRDQYDFRVPGNWVNDFLVITRPVGSVVSIDGMAISDSQFLAVGVSGQWEVARLAISDGLHRVTGSAGIGVSVVGFDSFDSYAFPAGLDQTQNLREARSLAPEDQRQDR